MPSLIGPSHHLFYGSLHRRRRWLNHLCDAFEQNAVAAWPAARQRLDSSFARTLHRLSTETHLGIQLQLPLSRVVDDTPIDTFLTTLSDELDAYEHNLFDLMHKHIADPQWLNALEEASMLWGRELAQEARISMKQAGAAAAVMPGPGTQTLRGMPMAFLTYLHGGDFSWKPLLFRCRTDQTVQYELRSCPHRKPVATPESANSACRLDSMVHKGFVQALIDDVRFERRSFAAYCVDELTLE